MFRNVLCQGAHNLIHTAFSFSAFNLHLLTIYNEHISREPKPSHHLQWPPDYNMLLFLTCLLYLLRLYIICPPLRAGLSVYVSGSFCAQLFWWKADMRCPARAVLFIPTILHFLAVVCTIECHISLVPKGSCRALGRYSCFMFMCIKGTLEIEHNSIDCVPRLNTCSIHPVLIPETLDFHSLPLFLPEKKLKQLMCL